MKAAKRLIQFLSWGSMAAEVFTTKTGYFKALIYSSIGLVYLKTSKIQGDRIAGNYITIG